MSSRAVSVKKSMIQNAVNQLQKSDFEVYNYNLPDIELCFELLARHQSHAFPSLLLKFCENIDRLKPHTTQELKLLSHIISAMPVLIGRKNRRDNLQDNIVYERENLIAINDVTFKKIINSPEYPLALAKRGGYFYNINGKKLKQLRKEKNLSQSKLAKKIGVSRKSISSYENTNMRASIEKAKKMKEILDGSVVLPMDFYTMIKNKIDETIDFLELKIELQQRITKKTEEFINSINEIVEETGFKTFWPKASPLDIFIFQEDEDSHKVSKMMFFGGTNYDGKEKITKITQERFLQQQIPHSKKKGIIYDEQDVKIDKHKQSTLPYLSAAELRLLENPKEFKKHLYRKFLKLQEINPN